MIDIIKNRYDRHTVMASPRLFANGVDHCLPLALVVEVEVEDWHLFAPEHLRVNWDWYNLSFVATRTVRHSLVLIMFHRSV